MICTWLYKELVEMEIRNCKHSRFHPTPYLMLCNQCQGNNAWSKSALA